MTGPSGRCLAPARVVCHDPTVLRVLVAALALLLVPAAAAKPLLGVTGNAPRFDKQTGQASQVHQAFLGWGQGLEYGAPIRTFLPTLGPVPMITISTGGPGGVAERITTSAIAAGKGDAYLAELNGALADWGKGAYVRPLGEMNNPGNPWSRNAPAYRKAFARISAIVHGRVAGLKPAYHGALLQPNPFPRVRVVFSPLANRNAIEPYWPGDRYVDVVGPDIYKESGAPPWAAFTTQYGFAMKHHKPFVVPEWGFIGVDDSAFVHDMCTFVRGHAVEALLFFRSKPGSPFDLSTKPKALAAYSACVPLLGGPLPGWATG